MNLGEKTAFQEYLTNQGTVVKPYCWQRQNHLCAKCPYHIRTGEEARVCYAEFHRVFGIPYRSTATLRNKHLLFYELRSFSGRVVQKGHATNCTEQDNHPESMLFEAGGYLDAVTDAYENIRCIILYSNYSPCNEAQHRCVSKIYNAAWNREALRSLSSLWPQVTLQGLPRGAQQYLLRNFVYGIPETALYHPTLLSRTSDQRNLHQINNFTGMKPYFKKAFPQVMLGKPFQAMKGSLLPPVPERHLVPFPDMLLPFQREHLYPRPKNIVRHLKMPK
ncbi:PREDICTED: putative C-_U-editing enzyme APOBEC-4, partial [Apaloderma vittatum]|uniref:putative C->U-editing enzyme APOBEC-4 n=1 Tax=Apaloderma vittatum TaxID=57397 RepID=UPI00052128C5